MKMNDKRIEFLKGAIDHMSKRNMAFCYSSTGEFLAIGSCKKELAELLKNS